MIQLGWLIFIYHKEILRFYVQPFDIREGELLNLWDMKTTREGKARISELMVEKEAGKGCKNGKR